MIGWIRRVYPVLLGKTRFRVEGSMSAIFGNILKSQKSHLHQWKPENNGAVLLKVSILGALKQSVLLPEDGEHGNGIQLENYM